MCDHRWPILALVAALFCATVLSGQEPVPQGVPIQEEDLADPEMTANQRVDPGTTEAELGELFRRAEELFVSADQAASGPLFSQIIDLLELRRTQAPLSPAGESLLARSLAYRARVRFNLGETEPATADLRRLLEIAPETRLDPELDSPKLVELFNGLRRQRVGDLSLTLEPPDAEVRINGRLVDTLGGTVGVAAGPQTVEVSRPGYAPQTVPVEIRPGGSTSLRLTLERTSPVLRLHTRPQGAEVLVDGVARGSTSGTAPEGFLPEGAAAYFPREDFSAELVIADLPLGPQVIEIRKPGYRAYRAELQITELLDYPLPPIVLEEERGVIVLRNLPPGAEVRVGGEVQSPAASRAGTSQLSLPPGEHTLTIADGPAKMFSTQLQLGDRQTIEVNVKLRPGLTFLGVLGADATSASGLDQSLRLALAESGKWALLERGSAGKELLAAHDVTAAAMRVAAESGPAAAGVDWPALQKAADERVPGLVYVVAVLSNDLLATHADLWVWSAAPGPARPERLRMALANPEELARVRGIFDHSLTLRRPWVGALVIDSDAAPHPLVADVTPGGPAEEAGLAVGDLIVAVAQVPIFTGADFAERIAAAEPGETLELGLQSLSGARTARLALGTSPVAWGGSSEFLDAIAFAELRSLEETASDDSRWVVQLNQALILLRAGDWEQAVRQLRTLRAPQTTGGMGQAAVDYWLGVALTAGGPELRQSAAAAFQKAAVPGARLYHHDGVYVEPRAQARLWALGSPGQR